MYFSFVDNSLEEKDFSTTYKLEITLHQQTPFLGMHDTKFHDLNENGTHRLLYLKLWFSVSGSIQKELSFKNETRSPEKNWDHGGVR